MRKLDLHLYFSCVFLTASKEEPLAYLTFSGSGDGFTIRYFRPENQNVLPEEDEIKTLKEEEWIINEKGFFVLK